MMTGLKFSYQAQPDTDGVPIHYFECALLDSERDPLDAFLAANVMRSRLLHSGHDGTESVDFVELSTKDASIATLFKLTFGGLQ